MQGSLRQRYLNAMGIPLWQPKALAAQSETAETLVVASGAAVSKSESSVKVGLRRVTDVLPAAANEADTRAWLANLGQQADTPPKILTQTMGLLTPADIAVTVRSYQDADWEGLQAAVASCQYCGLAKTRTNTVFGVGDTNANWLIAGEAPGAEEDRQGEPFVGRAGQLLNNMLMAMGLARPNVYILNMVKCRPPNNRDPSAEEMRQCRPYLARQIALIQPKIILVVGRIAAQNLLHTDQPLGRLRGKSHLLPGTSIPVIVTYHPAYLLRKPQDKRKAWQDLQMALQVAHSH